MALAKRGDTDFSPGKHVLQNGDTLSQAEFHSVYERMPADFKAELLDGTVFVSDSVGLPHGAADFNLSALLALYCGYTPGVQGHSNTTVILGPKDEVQPDVFLRILPESIGQSSTLTIKDIAPDSLRGRRTRAGWRGRAQYKSA